MSEIPFPLAQGQKNDYEHALHCPPRMYPRSVEENGLYEGMMLFHISPEDTYTVATTSRIVCDAALVLVFNPDGSSDGLLSHYLPNTGSRLAHAENIKRTITQFAQGKPTFVLLLTAFLYWNTDPQNGKRTFDYLVKTLQATNNGMSPHIVSVPSSEVSVDNPSDIVLQVKKVSEGQEYTITVTRSEYRQTFVYKAT